MPGDKDDRLAVMATRNVTDDEKVTVTIHIDSDNTKTYISRLPDPKDRDTLLGLFNKTGKDVTVVPNIPEEFGGMLLLEDTLLLDHVKAILVQSRGVAKDHSKECFSCETMRSVMHWPHPFKDGCVSLKDIFNENCGNCLWYGEACDN
ncbi:hypothetical protein VPNG_04210 [Cytospora leucostoma]|uniref:Uncharacterized protein n=1 Tax=Cytospora leucostoma TaxID=1230097 RepID=A0A423XDZ5_9PEZI|nr:hypothetical protein VPNG_04210 [Cytospora leucostoma]